MTQHEMPIDLQWEPFKFKMDSFLLAVSRFGSTTASLVEAQVLIRCMTP